MAKEDRRYLERHGEKWRVTVPVPRPLHSVLGTKLKRHLNTDSLATANRLKWAVVKQLKQEISRRALGESGDPLTEEALALREALEQETDDQAKNDLLYHISLRADQIAGDPVEAIDGNERRFEYDAVKEPLAGSFYRLAVGDMTPLRTFFTQWQDQSIRSARVMKDDERAIDLLDAWCRSHQVDPAIEAITRKTAGRFVAQLFDDGNVARKSGGAGRTARTINKYISSLSGYWKWLKRRGHVEQNVWLEQGLPKEKTEEGGRPFTPEEIKGLLNGHTSEYLKILMRIAALTGARIDAIASLKISDCQGGVFKFKPQKKEKKARHVPIHSALGPWLERQSAGKALGDDLFPELPVPPSASERERSMPAVKLFSRYRKTMGVDERVPGKRTSLVSFHSFRRWFITEAERAGQAPWVIASVVGHKRQGMTLGLYSAGPDLEQFRQCVEAVQLPDGTS